LKFSDFFGITTRGDIILYTKYHPTSVSSFDVRGRKQEDGRHWSANEPFGNRAFFRAETKPAALIIKDVRLEVSSADALRVQ
jgi:hypothetical protein